MPVTRIVTEQTFLEIKSTGHGVPRDKARYIQENFSVGKDYIIYCKELPDEKLNVRCTQDCPTHLKVVKG